MKKSISEALDKRR
jgi:hypothetical protein